MDYLRTISMHLPRANGPRPPFFQRVLFTLLLVVVIVIGLALLLLGFVIALVVVPIVMLWRAVFGPPRPSERPAQPDLGDRVFVHTESDNSDSGRENVRVRTTPRSV